MKKLLQIVSLNLVALLLTPNLVFGQSEAKDTNLGKIGDRAEGHIIHDQSDTSDLPLSLTKKNCLEFVAFSLFYLPQSLKSDLQADCKKSGKKSKIVWQGKEYIFEDSKIFQADILAKTSLVSDYIYQTPFDGIYRQAGAKFGVPWQILSAVHEIESGRSGDTYISSYAGATGPMQFLPSTFAVYAQDGDGDGVARINDIDDAIYSAANHLARNGGAFGNLQGALFAYNHDYWYVSMVLYRARLLGYQG